MFINSKNVKIYTVQQQLIELKICIWPNLDIEVHFTAMETFSLFKSVNLFSLLKLKCFSQINIKEEANTLTHLNILIAKSLQIEIQTQNCY